MPTKVKIKIADNTLLRAEIDCLFEKSDHKKVAQWALLLAKHIIDLADISIIDVAEGFLINELWQTGKASVHEVRQASLKIHKIARTCQSEIHKNALRTAGHAVATGHMREHAMVASDYAIKTIELIYSKDIQAIAVERQWQLDALKKVM